VIAVFAIALRNVLRVAKSRRKEKRQTGTPALTQKKKIV